MTELSNETNYRVQNQKKFKNWVLCFVALFFFVQPVHSASSNETAPQKFGSKIKGILKNPKYKSEITNPELRADQGTLARWSLSSSLSYSGSPVSQPLGKNQPNPDNSPIDTLVSLSGSLGARYTLDADDMIGLGTGIRLLAPFHGLERTEPSSPYIYYSHFSHHGAVQMSRGVSASAVTEKSYRDVGEFMSLAASTKLKYRLGKTPLLLSFEGKLSWFLYNRRYNAKTDRNASNYYLSLYPGLDYRMTDKTTLKTSLSTNYANSRRASNWWNWEKKTVSQRLGVGVSITPTVYFYPYLNFYPQSFTWDTTTLSFSTTFSL